MAQENIALARPYAEAVLARAQETATLDQWSEMLHLLSALVQSPEIAALIASPKSSSAQIQAILLDIANSHLTAEGQNLLKVLIQNRRLAIAPDIAACYEQRKRDYQGALQVQVRSAYPLADEQKNILASALKKRLQRDIDICSEQDPELIGGVLIQAGDLVIDGSVRGQLNRLANQLRL